jgi:hypothetical protein
VKWWTISVTGYGDFEYFGTRAQADERAKQKAKWEGGRATVREATTEAAAAGAGHIRWRSVTHHTGPGTPQGVERVNNEGE